MRHTFFCIDGHTAGNPVRLVMGGAPALHGRTMSERRQDFLARFDWIRTGLMGVAAGKKRRRSPPSGASSCQSQAVYGQSWVSASESGDIGAAIVIPPVKTRDFNFQSISDAV